MNIEEIREAFRSAQYILREHADEQIASRHITIVEIGEAILQGEIIEEYPLHYRGPCCLIYGTTLIGRRLHVLVGFPPNCWMITAYEPNARWIDFKRRRREL